jgi:hypothetical protein
MKGGYDEMEGGKKKSKKSKGSKRSLPPKLLAFQKIVKAAAGHLGKGGRDAMRLAKVANDAAKKELGENADIDKLVNLATKLLKDNLEKYKSMASK